MKTSDIKGIIPPVITPMNNDDEQTVNHEALRQQVERLLAGGVHGMFPLGTNGEAYALSFKEKEMGMVRVVSDKVMVASVQDLMILPEYRRKGLGSFLISLCLQKLPCGNWSARTTPENYEFYRKCGFSMPDSQNVTMVYDGYMLAGKRGDR